MQVVLIKRCVVFRQRLILVNFHLYQQQQGLNRGAAYHQDGLSLGWLSSGWYFISLAFIRLIFRYGGFHESGLSLERLSSGWSFVRVAFMRVVFHYGGFDQGGLSLGWLSSGWSFIRVVFH